ncbi:hypothetical protein V2J09_015463 [Rumex salicifolius]
MEEVQIISKSMIKPCRDTWMGTIALTEWDMIVGRGYVPCVYLYPPSSSKGAVSGAAFVVDTLKRSLGTALTHFYPLAGRIRRTGGGRMEIRCHESTWGAELAEAQTPIDMAELGDLSENNVDGKGFQGLIPAVDYYGKALHEQPLLLAQVTFFRCGGFSLGLSVSRAVADGLGSLHFLREWARIARGEAMEAVPVHNRALLRAGEPPATRSPKGGREPVEPPPHPQMMVPPLLPDPVAGEQPPSSMTMSPLTTMVMLPLTKLQLLRLKHMANNTMVHSQNNIPAGPRCYSRVEALTAHIWRCASKARGHEGTKLNSIGVAIDVRRRVTPPLPAKYYGNAVMMMTATSSSEELNSSPLGYACRRVRLAIEAVTEEYVWADLDYWKRQPDLRVWRGLRTTEGMYVNPDVMVTSWFTLPLHGLDFGWGEETHMGPGHQTMEGISTILPGRHDGSALVAMCLQPAHVNDFKAYFYDVQY